MKHLQTYESFKKTYGQKITQSKFKDIPIGTHVLYMGGRYTVTANDGYVIDLDDEDGETLKINLGQFNRAGQINEKKSSIWKVAYAGKGFYGVYDETNDSDIEGEWPSKKAAQAEANKRNAANESLNEARSIEKIEKDRTKIINDMSEIVTNWKAAKQSGDKKAEASFLQRLKDLTAKKKDLDKEINQAVAGKDRFIELVISEHNTIYESVMSEIDILAKGAKNFKDFVKEFKKEFGEMGNEKELNAWLKSIYDSTQNESVNEGEMADQTIFDLWEEVYGEKFIHEYPKMFKVLKSRPKVDRKEFARIWNEIYGENFEKEYPAMWDKMDITG